VIYKVPSMLLIEMVHIFLAKGKKTIISKIKTEQHDETYDLSFMANPAAQILKKISKSVFVSLGPPPAF
jgi:hypothetical protein